MSSKNRNRVFNARLWDDAGREWARIDHDLSREEIGRLLADPTVKVGVHQCRHQPRWLAPGERQEVWKREIERNLHDVEGWRPPPGAPGQLPFYGTRWRSGDDDLLLFEDFD